MFRFSFEHARVRDSLKGRKKERERERGEETNRRETKQKGKEMEFNFVHLLDGTGRDIIFN